MRLFPVIATLLILLPASFAQEGKRVLLLPVQNLSGEKWEALKTNQVSKATEYLTKEFGKRGFEVIAAEQAKAVLLQKKIDLEDEENHRRTVLFDVAKALGADYVFFAVITHTAQKKQTRFLYEDVEGEATAKVWFLDVKSESPIISAKSFTARSGGSRMSFDNKGSDRQIQAAANVMRDALKPFFDAHPPTGKGER